MSRTLLIALTYSLCVGMLATVTMAALMPRLRTVDSRPGRWLLILLLLFAATALGCSAGGVLLVSSGVSSESFWPTWRENVRFSLFISLAFGVGLVLYDQLGHRLEATTLALKQRELEHERALNLAAQAQLASLSSRIHPHFLFNTLSSISVLIREDPGRAERMVEHLSNLLRFSLDAVASEPVTLDRELRWCATTSRLSGCASASGSAT